MWLGLGKKLTLIFSYKMRPFCQHLLETLLWKLALGIRSVIFYLCIYTEEKGTNSQKTDKLFTILAFWSVSIYSIILQTQPKDISPRKCMYTYRSGCDHSISYWSVRNNSLLNCQNLFDTLAANTGPISKGWHCKNHLLFILIVTF